VCDRCGHQRIFFNSCSDRHCPKCQSLARASGLRTDNRASRLPVFSCCFYSAGRDCRYRPSRTSGPPYDILFRATAETLATIAADPQHLGAEIGPSSLYSTVGVRLCFHPHLHCVVPGADFSPDGKTWISCRPRFFLPVECCPVCSRRCLCKVSTKGL